MTVCKQPNLYTSLCVRVLFSHSDSEFLMGRESSERADLRKWTNGAADEGVAEEVGDVKF